MGEGGLFFVSIDKNEEIRYNSINGKALNNVENRTIWFFEHPERGVGDRLSATGNGEISFIIFAPPRKIFYERKNFS